MFISNTCFLDFTSNLQAEIYRSDNKANHGNEQNKRERPKCTSMSFIVHLFMHSLIIEFEQKQRQIKQHKTDWANKICALKKAKGKDKEKEEVKKKKKTDRIKKCIRDQSHVSRMRQLYLTNWKNADEHTQHMYTPTCTRDSHSSIINNKIIDKLNNQQRHHTFNLLSLSFQLVKKKNYE